MPASWSLIMNAFLLIIIIVIIWRMVKTKQTQFPVAKTSPLIGAAEAPSSQYEDIIAVRKIVQEDHPPPHSTETISAVPDNKQEESLIEDNPREITSTLSAKPPTSLMIFLSAKEKRQFVGYELLQTILTAGLRYGNDHLFHRHQHPNGHGPILCSLAAATATGTFDLQNIGTYSVHGLCLFMQKSGNTTIDSERLTIMIDTAKELCEELDAFLLDDQRQPFTQDSGRYYQQLLR